MIHAHVTLTPDTQGEIEWTGDTLRLGDIHLTLPLDKVEAADWCSRLGIALLAKADELTIHARKQRRDLAKAEEMVATIRRAHGEIAPDGWCWDCKADDHHGHRFYHRDGACIGCACDHRAAESTPGTGHA